MVDSVLKGRGKFRIGKKVFPSPGILFPIFSLLSLQTAIPTTNRIQSVLNSFIRCLYLLIYINPYIVIYKLYELIRRQCLNIS